MRKIIMLFFVLFMFIFCFSCKSTLPLLSPEQQAALEKQQREEEINNVIADICRNREKIKSDTKELRDLDQEYRRFGRYPGGGWPGPGYFQRTLMEAEFNLSEGVKKYKQLTGRNFNLHLCK